MDPWLTNRLKETLVSPCLNVAAHLGDRLDSRLTMRQSIDERALTEDFVDLFDSTSTASLWGLVGEQLRDQGLHLTTSVKKSTREARTGADIGLIIERSVQRSGSSSRARYAALIQCKKVDGDGLVTDFYHTVSSTGRKQSALMLDITASSFYFVFVPPSLADVVTNLEPIAFVIGGEGCSSPVWNMGCFEFSTSFSAPIFSRSQKAAVTGILVVPALAVEAQRTTSKRVALKEIIANCIPFWYWFGELFVPGFVGDYSKRALSIASNVAEGPEPTQNAEEFGVRFSVTVGLGHPMAG